MTIATASSSVGNSVTADAVAGAQSHGSKKSKGKADFSDLLASILSAQTATQNTAPESAATQDSSDTAATGANDTIKKAASNLPNAAATAGTAPANPTLVQAMNALRSNSPSDATDDTDPTAATPTPASTPPSQTGSDHHTHIRSEKLTAATQAKLVAALAKAANKPTPITGSDGQTAASSSNNGTPATTDAQSASAQPAQSETQAQLAQTLAAMQAAQPAVTTIATGTTPSITSRTMPQLEKAALTNTAKQATHASTPAAKVEAQALGVPQDAKSAKADSDSGAQTGSGGGEQTKDQFSRAVSDAAKTADTQTPAQTLASQQAVNATPSTAPTAANVNASDTSTSAAAASSVGQTTATQPTTIATTLQVAQQTSNTALAQQPNIAALALSIASKSADGQKQFDIRMEPAELGRVDVRLSTDSSGKTQAHITADKPQTLELLQNDKSTLAQSLKDAGIDLSNSGLNFSLRGQQQNSTPTFMARNRALSISAVQTPDISASTSSTSTAPGDSRLDIRV
ncbi:MAG TPA: flagellar hook-length control protein FliK [Rhizomicrobium sp.]